MAQIRGRQQNAFNAHIETLAKLAQEGKTTINIDKDAEYIKETLPVVGKYIYRLEDEEGGEKGATIRKAKRPTFDSRFNNYSTIEVRNKIKDAIFRNKSKEEEATLTVKTTISTQEEGVESVGLEGLEVKLPKHYNFWTIGDNNNHAFLIPKIGLIFQTVLQVKKEGGKLYVRDPSST